MIKRSLKKYIFSFIFFANLLVACGSIFAYYHSFKTIENAPVANWTLFYTWFFNFIVAVLFALAYLPHKLYQSCFNFLKKERNIIAIIFILALLSRVIFLTVYPYIRNGDELRDAALIAIHIHHGDIKDLFGVGWNGGYGILIPLISYFFSLFLHNSILINLLPTIILGTMSIVFTYILARLLFSRAIGLGSALLLIGSVVHLLYTRTYLVVTTDSFFAPLILLNGYIALKNKRAYLLLGLVCGLALHFYTGIYGTVIFIFMYCFVVESTRMIKSTFQKKSLRSILHLLSILLLFSIGLTIGGGPKLYRLVSLHESSGTMKCCFILKDRDFLSKNTIQKMDFIKNVYIDSFSIFIKKPTTSHFGYDHPLLPFPLNIFLLVAIVAILVQPVATSYVYIIFLYILFFPITNQVMINWPAPDYRLLGIVPILYIATAFGFFSLLSKIKKLKLKYTIYSLLIIIHTLSYLFFYYLQRPNDIFYDNQGIREYVLQSMTEYIQADKIHTAFYVLKDDPEKWYLNHDERLEFYAYPRPAIALGEASFYAMLNDRENSSNALFIMFHLSPILKGYQTTEIKTICDPSLLNPEYNCPHNYHGSYRFYTIN